MYAPSAQHKRTYCFCVPDACYCHLSAADKGMFIQLVNEHFILDLEARQYDDLYRGDYYRRKNAKTQGGAPP